ncbi:MAG: NAD(P)/FAD-dependent oxidoreductase [Cyanobacteria bacterium J06632_22]
MQNYDVVVVGGGPAGGHCARLLTQQGYRVLLVERYKDFERNSFSSAGVPLEAIEKYNLPESVIGTYWNELVIVTSKKKGVWTADSPQGGVLDFAKLRQFLADETLRQGGTVWMGCRYVNHSVEGDTVTTTIKNNLTGTTETVQSRLLVDATGAARAITRRKGIEKPALMSASGVEYLIKVDNSTYRRHSQALAFLLGYKWMPKGYSWVFPMQENYLKVGAAYLDKKHKISAAEQKRPLKYYIELLISEYLDPKTFDIVDIHGEAVRYSLGLQDIYWEDGVIAIGDTVSTINFLGGEGIRHAMHSAEIAQGHIVRFLAGETKTLEAYRTEMHDVFLKKWQISERLALKKYSEDPDDLVDKIVSYLRPMPLEEVIDVLFFYKFEKVTKGLGRYLFFKAVSNLKKLPHRLKQISGLSRLRNFSAKASTD